jgi:hypothetical protein
VFPHACAEAVKYGTGCNTVRGSAHQEFTDSSVPSAAGAASAALTNRQLLFLPSGTGYVMLPGTATFLPPSGAAVALPSNDDGETAITPTLPFQYPGGITTQLFVHTNGFVSVASNNTIPGGLNYVPQIPGMLAATSTGWWSWHDLNPTEAASGQIVWEEVGSIVAITWQGVESYPTTAANPSTFQFQFDMLAGTVTILWQTIDAVGGSGFLEGDDWVIGYSPGGPSPNGVAFDITTLTATALAFPEVFPLALDTSSKPLLGTTIDLVTSNETGQNLGINFVSVVGIPAPGFDLSILGMPGCVALLDINAGVGNVISNLGLPGISMNVSFPLPPNPALASIKIYSQSIWLDPLANPFGATASNAIEMTLGNF